MLDFDFGLLLDMQVVVHILKQADDSELITYKVAADKVAVDKVAVDKVVVDRVVADLGIDVQFH